MTPRRVGSSMVANRGPDQSGNVQSSELSAIVPRRRLGGGVARV
jgi:hypothetical protein